MVYQWLFNGTNLTNNGQITGSQSNVLTISNVSLSNLGSYDVVVTNAFGSVTSAVASLTLLDCVPPPSGLVSWFPLNGSVTDIVGGIVPSATNAISFIPSEFGQGVTFGTQGYIELPDSTKLANSNFTWEAWVLPSGPGPDNDEYGNVILEDFLNTSFLYNLMWSSVNDQFVFYCGNQAVFSSNEFLPGQFYHVAGTYDGTNFNLYVNGTLQGQLSEATTMAYGEWFIGSTATISRTWNGVINEVSIYNRALSLSEIQSIYNAGSAGKCMGSPPTIQTAMQSGSSITFTWSATPTNMYQIQSTTNLAPANWTNLGGTITATNSTMTNSQAIGTNPQQFYRVLVVP